MRVFPALACLCLGLAGAASPASAAGVYLEALASSDVAEALRAGRRTVIIPVGGTEQNGAHMALGKHNVRVHRLAGRIAAELGDALVAPVLAYTPEGRIAPPTEHMRYAGTISISDATFQALLMDAARSLRQHGFTDIVLLGDSGNYQAQLKAVAAALNRDWAGTPARAHFIAAYYQATQEPFNRLLRERGLSDAQIGRHAGAADTSLMLAADPSLVWPDRFPADSRSANATGVTGDPTRASAELGKSGLDLIVQHSVTAIRAAAGARR